MPTTDRRPTIRRRLAALLAACLLAAASGAAAQEDPANEDAAHAPGFVIEALEPLPGETSEIVFRVDGASGQTPNVMLAGPMGVVEYQEEREGVFDGLGPGTWVLTATEDGHRIAVGRLELEEGMRARVLLTLFSRRSFYADEGIVSVLGFDFDVADNVDEEEEAALRVETDVIGATIAVTGPDGYQRHTSTSEEVELDDLEPGRYHVAVTAPDYGLAQGTFDLLPGRRLELRTRMEAIGPNR